MTRREKSILAAVLVVNLGLGVTMVRQADLSHLVEDPATPEADPIAALEEPTSAQQRPGPLPQPKD